MTSRELARVARNLADQQTRKRQAIPNDRHIRATVTTVTAGAATGGTALVKITYRGTEMPVADYPDSYTPVVNDRVLCVIVDLVPSILHHCIGYP